MKETSSGIATTIDITCSGIKKLIGKKLKRPHPDSKALIVATKRFKPTAATVRRRFIIRCLERTEKGERLKSKSNSKYAKNVMFFLSLLMNGTGATEGANTLAMLGLPGSHSYDKTSFFRMSKPIYKKIIEVARETTESALREEIECELETMSPRMTYDEWIKLPAATRPKVGITISYDMGWNKRSSGRR